VQTRASGPRPRECSDDPAASATRRATLSGVQARILIAAALAALAGSAPGVAAERSSHVYTVPGQRIKVALPSSWRAVDAKHVLTSAQLQALERENPELGSALSAMTQPGSPVKFFAFDPVARQQFATNLNVVVSPIGQKINFDLYASALASEIHSLSSVSQLKTTRVTLPGGPAVRLSYRLDFTVRGKRIQVATLQYGFLRGGGTQSVVFTYTTLPQLQSRYAALFSASVSSISFR
jgi:hypothetical protein